MGDYNAAIGGLLQAHKQRLQDPQRNDVKAQFAIGRGGGGSPRSGGLGSEVQAPVAG